MVKLANTAACKAAMRPFESDSALHLSLSMEYLYSRIRQLTNPQDKKRTHVVEIKTVRNDWRQVTPPTTESAADTYASILNETIYEHRKQVWWAVHNKAKSLFDRVSRDLHTFVRTVEPD